MADIKRNKMFNIKTNKNSFYFTVKKSYINKLGRCLKKLEKTIFKLNKLGFDICLSVDVKG